MKIIAKIIVISFLVLTFLSGFVVVFNNSIQKMDEKTIKLSSPNLLLRNGNTLSLLETSQSNNNYVVFNKLEDYKQYQSQEDETQRKPTIYLREENDIQGKDVYKMYSDPFDCEIGVHTMTLKTKIEPKIDDTIKANSFNNNSYMSYDKNELNVGINVY